MMKKEIIKIIQKMLSKENNNNIYFDNKNKIIQSWEFISESKKKVIYRNAE